MFLKKILQFSIILFLGLLTAKSVSAAITIRPALNLGLVGYWSMDEGSGSVINDQSGNRNTGITYSSTTPAASWADGKLGKAVNFDGTDDYVDLGNGSSLNFASGQGFSISAWVKTSDDYGQIVSFRDSVDSQPVIDLAIGDNGASTNAGHFLPLMRYDDSSGLANFTSTTDISDNTWHFVTMVYDPSAQKIYAYVDNSSWNVTQTVTGSITTAVDRAIGAERGWVRADYESGDQRYLSGSFDEVRIYNRALSAGEVGRLYKLTKPKFLAPNNTGLVGYWSFEEGLGTIAGDMSGNGKTGTITGATWTDGKRGKALSFNGTSAYVDAGNVYNGVKTISFWLKADATTGSVIDLNGTDKVEISSGTITTNIASPTIYVDGAVSSTVDTNWHYVTITTGTGINASAATLGKVGPSWACGDTLTYCGDNYATVQMTSGYGSQCWLQENLRNTTKPDCTTAITSYCHGSGCGSPWGRLYTWTTMMNGSTTATGCGAKIQGICPAGWHIPSDYTSCSTDDFPALGTNGGALKKVNTSSGVPWTEPNTGATNASNWTGYPAGDWYSGFTNRGITGIFLSSAESSGTYAWVRGLDYSTASWVRYTNLKAIGVSVRCVKDTGGGSASYFSGKLDEVRMYNRALSATEVASLYQSSSRQTTINSSQNSRLTSGLVGMWSFNGADIQGSLALDRSGNGNNGTITGATPTIGKVGQALSFDGTSGYVDIPYNFSQPSTITISLWFKTRDTNGALFGQADFVKPPTVASSYVPILFITDFGNLRGEFYTGTTGGITTTSAANNNQWHQAVLIGDTSVQYLYVDGNLVGSRNGSIDQSWWGYSTIGTGYDSGNRGGTGSGWKYLNVQIDEVRVYNRALAAGEVQQLYNMSAPAFRCGDPLLDNRDGKNYATVQIGTQCWMKQNLNVGTRVNGGTGQGTSCASINKWCYSDTDANCDSNLNPNYPDGGLYMWDQAMCGLTTPGAQGICPAGWHIPTDAEMCTMEQVVDSSISCSTTGYRGTDGGTKLKPNGTSGWEGNSAGYCCGFAARTEGGNFWSSSQDTVNAWVRYLNSAAALVYRDSYDKSNGFSVRCVKN